MYNNNEIPTIASQMDVNNNPNKIAQTDKAMAMLGLPV